jgi:cell division protein FtsI/penicillin-binding protein 2
MWMPAFVFGLFAFIVLARLAQLQILDHRMYANQAKTEQAGQTTVFARRGAVLDRNGNALAVSTDTWDVYVNSRTWKNDARGTRAAQQLGARLRMSPSELRDRVTRSTGDVLIRRDVDYDTGRDIVRDVIPGVVMLPNSSRTNPEGDTAASLLGFIGQDNVGLAGIEASFNDTLMGRPGRAIFERDTTGEPIPFGQYIASDPVPGQDVVLTIDRFLQQLAERRLAEAMKEHRAQGGAIIMMDPATGEILALATSPGIKYTTLNLNDPAQVELMKNPAVTDVYEPGSVMKVVTAAAAIDRGAVTPDSTYVDNGIALIYDVQIKNWDDNVYGLQSMTEVLQNSINTGAIYMQQQLEAVEPGAFQRYLAAFGFDRPSGIDLSGEAIGIMRRPTDADWSPVDLATQSFGQSISVTPIQMINAIATAINGGNLMRPHIAKAYVSPDGRRTEIRPEIVGRAISAETSATVRKMLYAVVNPEGRSHPGRPRDYTAGGKSGTANVPIWGSYDDRQVASFVGFAPAEDPRIVVLIKLDQNQDLLTGTVAAGPIFSKLADEALHYLNVRPDAARYAAGAR